MMVDAVYAPENVHLEAEELKRARDGEMAFFSATDGNHDGSLTLEEMLRLPLATFDCLDTDRNDSIAADEISDGVGHCGSFDAGSGKIIMPTRGGN